MPTMCPPVLGEKCTRYIEPLTSPQEEKENGYTWTIHLLPMIVHFI